MKSDFTFIAQLYAGKITNAIPKLVDAQSIYQYIMQSNGVDPEVAEEEAERVYEAASKFINENGKERGL